MHHRAHKETTEGSSARRRTIFWVPPEFKCNISGTTTPLAIGEDKEQGHPQGSSARAARLGRTMDSQSPIPSVTGLTGS